MWQGCGAPKKYHEKHRAPARAPRAGVNGGSAPDGLKVIIKSGANSVTGIRYLRYYLILARGGLACEDCSREFRISEVSPIKPPPEAERRARPARGEPRARARSARERATIGSEQGGMPKARPPTPRPHRRKHRRRVINNGGARGASPTGEARTHAGGLPPKPPATLCRILTPQATIRGACR